MAKTFERSVSTSWLRNEFRRLKNWLRSTVGVDRAVGFTILARGWGSLAGLVTVGLIAHFLSRPEQGYYYTFGSLIALQLVFELGFSFVILQLASHERAHLNISMDESISGDAIAHARLASVLQTTVRWYSVAAILLAAFLLTAGSHFFSMHSQNGGNVAWRFPWYAAAIAATLTFQIDPILSFMEGCGFISNVARLRFAQAAVGSTLAWVALGTRHGLFAPAAMILGNALVSFAWLIRRRRLLVPLLRQDPGEHRILWIKEVWPFQWRIAVSWLCGYFIYQLFTPILFAYRGAVEAGQMGMSLSLANALQSVAISWMNTKASPFGVLIARKDYVGLDDQFFRALRQSGGVFALGSLAVLVVVEYLNWEHVRFTQRLLGPMALGVLLLTTLINVVVFGEALYLRAHKQEKFLFISILGAVLTAGSTFFLGKEFGAIGMVIGNFMIGTSVGLPLATYTFLRYRRIWHVQQ